MCQPAEANIVLGTDGLIHVSSVIVPEAVWMRTSSSVRVLVRVQRGRSAGRKIKVIGMDMACRKGSWCGR